MGNDQGGSSPRRKTRKGKISKDGLLGRKTMDEPEAAAL